MNPDTIAEALPRVDGRLDERGAGVRVLEQRRGFLRDGASFAVETTMSGHGTLQLMRTAARAGYKVTLVYIGLRSAGMSTERVIARVGRGGHSVLVDAIQRRYPDTMSKLADAVAIADRSYVLDNSDRRRRLLLIAERGVARFRARSLPTWLRAVLPAFV